MPSFKLYSSTNSRSRYSPGELFESRLCAILPSSLPCVCFSVCLPQLTQATLFPAPAPTPAPAPAPHLSSLPPSIPTAPTTRRTSAVSRSSTPSTNASIVLLPSGVYAPFIRGTAATATATLVILWCSTAVTSATAAAGCPAGDHRWH